MLSFTIRMLVSSTAVPSKQACLYNVVFLLTYPPVSLALRRSDVTWLWCSGHQPQVGGGAAAGARPRHDAPDRDDSSAEQRATAQTVRAESQPRGPLGRASPRHGRLGRRAEGWVTQHS